MAKPGPKPARADGCHITRKGYLERNVRVGDRLVLMFEHQIVWERHHGPVPDGFQLHHINEIKTDNRIENLQLVTPLEHKRIHSGCVLIDGVWWKPCHLCGESKPITNEHWYFQNGYPAHGRCKPCHIQRVVAAKRARRARVAAP